MPIKEEQLKAIEMMAAYEEALCSLYKVYTQKLPTYRDFWLKLSSEEAEHAMWVRDFENKAKEGLAYFDKNRFNLQAIKISLDYVNEQIESARSKDILPIKALSMSLDLESALIDNQWFEAFATDSAALRNLMEDLREAVKKHRERVKRAWEKERASRKGE